MSFPRTDPCTQLGPKSQWQGSAVVCPYCRAITVWLWLALSSQLSMRAGAALWAFELLFPFWATSVTLRRNGSRVPVDTVKPRENREFQTGKPRSLTARGSHLFMSKPELHLAHTHFSRWCPVVGKKGRLCLFFFLLALETSPSLLQIHCYRKPVCLFLSVIELVVFLPFSAHIMLWAKFFKE